MSDSVLSNSLAGTVPGSISEKIRAVLWRWPDSATSGMRFDPSVGQDLREPSINLWLHFGQYIFRAPKGSLVGNQPEAQFLIPLGCFDIGAKRRRYGKFPNRFIEGRTAADHEMRLFFLEH